MSLLRLYPVALALIIGGCAGSMGTVPPIPPPVPPVTAFDGSYRNTLRAVNSFGSAQILPWCETPGQPVITVAKGQLTYTVPHPSILGNPSPMFVATVAPDGTFYGEVIAGIVSGQIQGSQIQGKIDGSACIYRFSGNRV